MHEENQMNIQQQLSKPYPKEELKFLVNFGYRAKDREVKDQNGKWGKANVPVMIYVNATSVKNRLDNVFGPMFWKNEYRTEAGNLFCRISVWNSEINQWIYKEDVGVESNIEEEKGQASDSLKRTAFNWGPGRYFYELGELRGLCLVLKSKDSKGNEVWKPIRLEEGELERLQNVVYERSKYLIPSKYLGKKLSANHLNHLAKIFNQYDLDLDLTLTEIDPEISQEDITDIMAQWLRLFAENTPPEKEDRLKLVKEIQNAWKNGERLK